MSVGQLTALSPATLTITGEGAHKACASADGKHVYVCNTAAKTVTVYKREPGGGLAVVETTSATATGGPTDIAITPDGSAVFVAQGTTGFVLCFTRNESTGALTLKEEKACGSLARNLVVHPNGKYLYVTSEGGNTVIQLEIEAAAKLKEIGTPFAVGTKPRGVDISPDGKTLYVANFGSHNVSQAKVEAAGTLAVLSGSPVEAGEGADIVACSPDGLNVYVSDFGAAPGTGTTIHQYEREASGKLVALSPASVTCGTGPTDLKVAPDGATLTVCCFAGEKVQTFTRGVKGALTLQTSYATVKEMEGLCYSPDGTALYAVSFWNQVSSSKSGLLYQFHRTPLVGQLTAMSPETVECGEEPQRLAVSPDNKFVYVAGAKSGTISCYKRAVNGALTALATRDIAVAAGTYDIVISPDGKFLYCCNRDATGAKAIAQFSRNLTTGVITPLSPAFVEAKEVTGGAENSEHAGPHSITMSSDGKFVYICTQSKPGRIYQYARDTTTGLLTPLSPEFLTTTRMLFDLRLSPAAGNPYAFGAILGALFSSEQGEVVVLSRDEATGKLTIVETVSSGSECKNTSALVVSPDGKNLYVTNREPLPGNNTHGVSMFSIGVGGKLTALSPRNIETYEEPRGIWCSPGGNTVYVCDQGGRYVHCFDRDASTGLLTLKEVADTGVNALNPSHGAVSPNGVNYYHCDKNNSEGSKGHLTSQWARRPSSPTITKPGAQSSTRGTATAVSVEATGIEEYGASGLPAGLAIDAISGVISGTPTAAGETTVTVTAKSVAGTAETTFIWKVVEPTTTVSKPPAQLSTVGVADSYAIEAVNATSYAASGLPEGLSINASTGVISGTPLKVQAPTVTITVKGPTEEASTTFVWTVEAAPTITKPANQSTAQGNAVSLSLAPAGQAAYAASGLPVGLAINAATGVISGTPTTVEAPTVTVKAFNANGSEASTTFTWTITLAPLPPGPVTPPVIEPEGEVAKVTLTKPSDKQATVGVAIASWGVSATNATNYTATGLPAGLSMNASTGLVSGTATTPGTSTVTVKVKGTIEGVTETQEATFVYEVAALAIANPGAQEAKLGAQVNLQLVSAGATSFTASGLPAGLSLDSTTGLITGTLTALGTSAVTVTAHLAGASASATFPFVVVEPAGFELSPLAIELLGELPPVLRTSRDYQAAIQAEAKALEAAEAALETVRDQFTPGKADVLLGVWEQVVKTGSTGSLDERRTRVVGRLRKALALGEGAEWVQLVNDLIGPGWTYEEHIPGDGTSPPANVLRVTLPFGPGDARYGQAVRLLEEVTPAHLILNFTSAAGFRLDISQLDLDQLTV